MSPDGNLRTGKPEALNDIYTALLAVTLVVILGTAVFMAIKCMTEYGTIFTIARP
jgi:hypothetical protein